MQFQNLALIHTLLAAVTAAATPSGTTANPSVIPTAIPTGNAVSVLRADVINTALTETDAHNFSCVLHCGAVLLASACIIGALDEGQTSIAKICLKGDEKELCDCVNCIPKLNTFAQSHHLC